MSECQVYYFERVSRPLSPSEWEAVNSLSSHIHVTSRSALVHYNYGDFKHDPLQVLKRYFDILVYHANWGSQIVAFRFDPGSVNLEQIARFAVKDNLSIRQSNGSVLIMADFEDNYTSVYSDYISDQSGSAFAGFAPIYNDILQGDHRSLFLLWLMACRLSWEDGPVPVPPGLGKLNDAYSDLTELIELDMDWVRVAAEKNPAPMEPPKHTTPSDFEEYLPKLSPERKDRYLKGILTEDPTSLRAQLVQELSSFRPKEPEKKKNVEQLPTITYPEVEQIVKEMRALHEREEAERKAAERKAYFEMLRKRAPSLWVQVPQLIEQRKPKAYHAATEILYALKTLAKKDGTEAEFTQQATTVLVRYPTLSSLRSHVHAAEIVSLNESRTTKCAYARESWKKEHPPDWMLNHSL